MNWQAMDSAKQDGSMMQLYCPGISPNTNGVLQGYWDKRLNVWALNPYGTVQPVALYPSMWADLTSPPTG